MRILQVLTQFFPSGLTAHVIDLSVALSRAGHEVTVLHGRDDAVAPYRPLLERPAGPRGTTIRLVPRGEEDTAPAAISVRPDIVHAHSTLDFALADRLAWEFGVPFILTLHGLGCIGTPGAHSLLRAGAVIAVGGRVAREASAAVPAVVVVENGIDTFRFRPLTTRGPSGAAFTVLYAGRLEPVKQPAFRQLVKAVQGITAHRPARLAVLALTTPHVGRPKGSPGPPASFADPEYLGWLADPSHEYRRADVIAGSGRVVREAMASGKPCLLLGRSYGGIVRPWFLDPSRGHDFSAAGPEPAGPAAIRHDLETLIGSEAERRLLGREGRRYALAHFDASSMAEKTLRVYRDAVDRGPLPGLAPPARAPVIFRSRTPPRLL